MPKHTYNNLKAGNVFVFPTGGRRKTQGHWLPLRRCGRIREREGTLCTPVIISVKNLRGPAAEITRRWGWGILMFVKDVFSPRTSNLARAQFSFVHIYFFVFK